MTFPHLVWTAAVAFLALSFTISSGCSNNGPKRAAVAGEVLVDKVPLAEGTINFLPTEGNEGPSAGIAVKDGKYSIPLKDGAVVGKNLVRITGFRKTGRKVPDAMEKDKMIDEMERAVGPEFNESTTLVRDVVEGKNNLDFDLPGIKK